MAVEYLIELGDEAAETSGSITTAMADTWRYVVEPLGGGRTPYTWPVAILYVYDDEDSARRPVYAVWSDPTDLAHETTNPRLIALAHRHLSRDPPPPPPVPIVRALRARAQQLLDVDNFTAAADTYLVASDAAEQALPEANEANVLRGAALRIRALLWARRRWPDLQLEHVYAQRPRRGLAVEPPHRFLLAPDRPAPWEPPQRLPIRDVVVSVDRRGGVRLVQPAEHR